VSRDAGEDVDIAGTVSWILIENLVDIKVESVYDATDLWVRSKAAGDRRKKGR